MDCYFLKICFLGLVSVSCCKNDNPLVEIPLVTTGEVQDISDNTAVCGGYIISDGGSSIIKCGVCWGPDSTLLFIEDASHIVDFNDTGSYTSSIIKLTPNTTFFVRAYAKNKLGVGYGKTKTFTTVAPYKQNINFNPSIEYDKLIDQDGNTYKTVNIGSQIWMAENLKAISYSSGISMKLGIDYNWYNNDINATKGTYGACYSWSVLAIGHICPIGWHVPNGHDWSILIGNLGGNLIAGGKLKEAGLTHWKYPNSGATNESGFTALPDSHVTDNLVQSATYWDTYVIERKQAGVLRKIYSYNYLSFDNESFLTKPTSGGAGRSHVRCIKN